MARSGGEVLSAPAEFSPLGDLFAKYTGLAANQALAEGAAQSIVRPTTFPLSRRSSRTIVN